MSVYDDNYQDDSGSISSDEVSDSNRFRTFVQAWFADDAQAAGRLSHLRTWWDTLKQGGPHFGYHLNPLKSVLVVKEHKFEEAKQIFKGTGLRIARGHKDLGAALGSVEFVEQYIAEKVAEWVRQVELLSEIALSQPHAAYAAFVHGLQHRWTFCQRTMQMQEHLGPLERVVRTKLLPALLGDSTPLSDVERELFALPCKYGGLAINNSVADARHRLADSRLLSLSLQKKLLAGEAELGFDQSEHRAVVSSIKAKWASRYESRRVKLYRENPGLKRIIQYASEKGASNILTTLPLEKYGFAIKAKKDFRDLLCLRYRRPVKRLPSSCVCGAKYSLDHSQICKRGGFIHMRHDDPKNCFLLACSQVHRDTQSEPHLEPVSGEQFRHKSAITSDDARSDARVRSFWSRMRNAFFEFRVFYPFARSYSDLEPSAVYKLQANARKREYAQRIRDIEDGDFTPMIMASTGGMGPEMSMAVKHLARKIADNRKENYASVVNVLRCELAFAVARAALVCLRGSRGIWQERVAINPIDDVAVAFSEACR